MARRVLVMWSNPLFHESMRLLLTSPQVEVADVQTGSTGVHALIKATQPDTIIVEDSGSDHAMTGRILNILESSLWKARVWRLSLEDNELHLYQRKQWVIQDDQQLIDLIINVGDS